MTPADRDVAVWHSLDEICQMPVRSAMLGLCGRESTTERIEQILNCRQQSAGVRRLIV